MEFYLENYFGVNKITTTSNIFALYGNNNSGKTTFVGHINSLIRVNRFLINEVKFINYNDVILINENFNLKKELELQKTSAVRKQLLNNLYNELEERDLNFLETLNSEKEVIFIKDYIEKHLKLSNFNYKVKSKLSVNNSVDLIDKLFKLQLVDQNNIEIEENLLSRTEHFSIFVDFFTSNNPEGKIFIFDSPDIGLDNTQLINFANLIKKISEQNLVFITYNNPILFYYLDLLQDNFFYITNNKIKCIYFSDDTLFKSYWLNLNNELEPNIDKIKNDYWDLIDSEEMIKLKEILYVKFFLKYLDKIDFLLSENNLFISKNEKIIWKNILNDNKFLLEK